VAFSIRDGVEHPVICVPAGVKIPASAKKELAEVNKKLIERGAIYFCTLNASGIVSTSAARPEDWRDIFEICFENREADIGRFFRKALSASESEKLADALRKFLATTESPQMAQQSITETATSLLDAGEERFQHALAKSNPDEITRAMAAGLTWQVAITVDPPLPERDANKDFLAQVLGSNARYTGWPVWIDLRGASSSGLHPYRADAAWESIVSGTSAHLDFWRIEPAGHFYLRRALQDDLTDKVAPGTALEPILVLIRVAEAIAVGLAMVRTLVGADDTERRLGFAFRWTKLSNRKLISWANPSLFMIGEPQSREDSVTTAVEVPLGVPLYSIGQFVEEATKELFAHFEGETIPSNVIDKWTQKLINRQI
jgi:hypothetical protein